MKDKYFKVRYSQLSPISLQEEIIRRYHFEHPTCRFYDSGMNDIYLVKNGDDTLYLRISQTGMHELVDYEEEVDIINTLYENGITVAVPIKCADESYIWDINAPEGIRYAVLFEEAKKSPSEDKVKSIYNLGKMIARMHEISDDKDFKVSRSPIDLNQLMKQPLDRIKYYLEHRQDDYKYLSESSEKLSKYIEQKLKKEQPIYGFCHGDIHSGNIFFEENEPMIFDFDCMGYGWRAYDICVFAWNESYENEHYCYSEEWKAFMDGYNSVRQLSESERDTINAFIALRQLWLMGLHADVMERNAGCCWYNDAYFDEQIRIFKIWYQRTFNNL
ncbi:phosphotransferase enzyme family protein [Anaeromicropila herbilytica]|uniref:Aminoglycoside phosphotransferase domain-containing protein n=1 Tax=Anaeromicropila herbilytica TaxID=2785025 RepID=A0A7R7ID34_9FIRM|nr:phosphotransferase [Anaeromicropila herbilytica]BCN31162.1 hypothetical protein bsdtb5_24570 [Anaeromicropila herbilytica]